MVEFLYPHGVVYVFENSKAQRVKVGMTGIGVNNVGDRLRDANDMWLGRRSLARFVEDVWSTSGALFLNMPGGRALPLEKDVALAASYLQNVRSRLNELVDSEKGSATRIANTLEKRLERYRHRNRQVGTWQFRIAFFTKGVAEVESLSHIILAEHLDKLAPFGEVFCCSVSEATKAVEAALSQLGLLHSARKATHL